MDKAKNDQVSTNNKPKDKQTRKLPEIKQTLTSKYRMLKANPLLALEEKNKREPQTVDDLKKPWLFNCYVPNNFETKVQQQAGPSKLRSSSRQPSNGQLNSSNVDFSVNRRLESSTPVSQNSSRRDTIDFVAQNRKLVSNGHLRPGTSKAGEFKKPEIHGKPLVKARGAPAAVGVLPKQQTSNFSRGDSNRQTTGTVAKQSTARSKAASVSVADKQRQQGSFKGDHKALKHTSNPAADAKKPAITSDKNKCLLPNKPRPALRRSLSAQHIEKKKSNSRAGSSTNNNNGHGKNRNDSDQMSFTRTNSLDRNFLHGGGGGVAGSSKSPVENFKISVAYAPGVSPVTEEAAAGNSSSSEYRDTSLNFKTPGAFARRSIIQRTPNTESRRSNNINTADNSFISRRSSSAQNNNNNHHQAPIFNSSTPRNYGDLQRNLLEWLKRRGKSLSEYHHLKCFGLMHDGSNKAEAEGPVSRAEASQEQEQQQANGLDVAIQKGSAVVNGCMSAKEQQQQQQHQNGQAIHIENSTKLQNSEALEVELEEGREEEDDLEDDDKENIETHIPDLDDSYENSHIIPAPAPPKEVVIINADDDDDDDDDDDVEEDFQDPELFSKNKEQCLINGQAPALASGPPAAAGASSSNGVANDRTRISERVANSSGIAKEALIDLHKLILEGYPKDQCEVWLKLMHRQIARLDEEPQYWECRAAIEQARGNLTSAVECYKTAIIQGAEVKSVDKSLDKLLQKFSLLNINAEDGTSSTEGAPSTRAGSHRDRARILLDARNIFKSNIIQFAVRERKIKKTSNNEQLQVEEKQKVLVATPVRRSTRLSRSHYTSTPGVAVYSSLQEIEDSVSFRHNKALK